MSRCIDADALKRKAQKMATEAWKMNLTAKVETTLNQFIDWIDEMPTAIADHIAKDSKKILSSCCHENGKDTIYRQAAIDAFKKELTVGESKGNYVTICSAVGYEGAKHILESLPSVQPKIGKWVYGSPVTVKCNQCGFYIPDWEAHSSRFCRNCGARMEVKND